MMYDQYGVQDLRDEVLLQIQRDDAFYIQIETAVTEKQQGFLERLLRQVAKQVFGVVVQSVVQQTLEWLSRNWRSIVRIR